MNTTVAVRTRLQPRAGERYRILGSGMWLSVAIRIGSEQATTRSILLSKGEVVECVGMRQVDEDDVVAWRVTEEQRALALEKLEAASGRPQRSRWRPCRWGVLQPGGVNDDVRTDLLGPVVVASRPGRPAGPVAIRYEPPDRCPDSNAAKISRKPNAVLTIQPALER